MWARIAGVLWLICIAFGMFAEAYVRNKLVLPHDPAGTIRNIFSNEHCTAWDSRWSSRERPPTSR